MEGAVNILICVLHFLLHSDLDLKLSHQGKNVQWFPACVRLYNLSNHTGWHRCLYFEEGVGKPDKTEQLLERH